tara:strand:+ start:274 stop:642 length:369 start_codon:yes stop_codon:yes gene_type:complete
MKKIYYLLCLLLIGCNDSTISSITGTWHYNQNLYQKEVQAIDQPRFDLSESYEIIKMIFNKNGSFTSYLDKQTTKGKWEIKDSLLYMTPNKKKTGIYEFKYLDNELIIYDRDFVIALVRRGE